MSKTQHDGDCTIFAADHGGPTDGICTCGYGLQQLRKCDSNHINNGKQAMSDKVTAYHWNPTDGVSMQSSDRKPAMSNNIPGVPEGWRLVRIGVPEIGETVIQSEGKPILVGWRTTGVFPIVERIPPAWQPPEFPDACKLPWVAGIACDKHGWSVYSSPPAYKKYWDAGRESCIKWLGLPPVPEEHWKDSWVPNPCYDPQAKWPE